MTSEQPPAPTRNPAPDWTDEAEAKWACVRRQIGTMFLNVLRGAERSSRAMTLFGVGDRVEFLVDKKLAHISRVNRVQKGGVSTKEGKSVEQRTADRLRRVIFEQRRRLGIVRREGWQALPKGENFIFGGLEEKKGGDGQGPANADPSHYSFIQVLQGLADAYEEAEGRYYEVTPLPAAEGFNCRKVWGKQRFVAKASGDREAMWACDLAGADPKRGKVKHLSNFTLKPLFTLVRADGTSQRVVELTSIHGVRRQGECSGPVQMPSEALKTSVQWRGWLMSIGGFSWEHGDVNFQLLHEDWSAELADQRVYEIPYQGWHAESRMWLGADCAITAAGEVRQPGKHDIYWVRMPDGKKRGFRPAMDRDGVLVDCDEYRGPTKLHHGGVYYQPRTVLERGRAAGEFALRELRADEAGTFAEHQDPRVVRELFRKFLGCLDETLENYDGLTCVAMSVLGAAHPEVLARYSQFPGLQLVGEKGHGKSSIARWLMRMIGYHLETGVNIDSSTAPGMDQLSQQYSGLAVWFEEFQQLDKQGSKSVENFFKALFDGSGGAKVTVKRTKRCYAIVSGEMGPKGPAHRERYVQVKVDQSFRRNNHFDWFQRHRDTLFTIFREILRRRADFARTVAAEAEAWISDPSHDDQPARHQFVVGLIWGAFKALGKVFPPNPEEDESTAVAAYLTKRCHDGAADTQTMSRVDMFMSSFVSCLNAGVFTREEGQLETLMRAAPVTSTREEFERGGKAIVGTPPDAPDQTFPNCPPWVSWRLCLRIDDVLHLMKAELRRGGEQVELTAVDLMAQMAGRPWFVHWKGTNLSIGGSATRKAVVIDLDRMPSLGYVPTPTEQVAAQWHNHLKETQKKDSINLAVIPSASPLWAWEDPRLGPLYSAVRKLHPNAAIAGSSVVTAELDVGRKE